MNKEAILTITLICICFSIIPFSHIEFGTIHWPQGMMVSIVLLLIFLGYVAYDTKKLFDNKEDRLAKNFILAITLSIIISIAIIIAIWRYTFPPISV